MRKQVRKLRHWKQRFDKNAAFVWRRKIKYAGELTQPGEPIPDALQDHPTKLRRFWESQTIELAEFEEPDVATGQPQVALVADEPVEIDPPIEGVSVTKGNGSWFIVSTDGDEVKVNGQRALDELIDELRFEADVSDVDINLEDTKTEEERNTEMEALADAETAAQIAEYESVATEDDDSEQSEQNEEDDDASSGDEVEQSDEPDAEKPDDDFLK